METKVCSKCKVEKLLENFVKKNNSPDGCGNTCNQCNNERGRKYRIKNKEKIKNYCIENKEKNNLTSKNIMLITGKNNYLTKKNIML